MTALSPRPCSVCGQDFIPGSPRAKAHPGECSKEYHRRQVRQHYWANAELIKKKARDANKQKKRNIKQTRIKYGLNIPDEAGLYDAKCPYCEQIHKVWMERKPKMLLRIYHDHHKPDHLERDYADFGSCVAA